MNWIFCSECDAAISGDDDPDCFVEVGNMRRMHKTIVLCQSCREEREDQQGCDDQQAQEYERKAEEEVNKTWK